MMTNNPHSTNVTCGMSQLLSCDRYECRLIRRIEADPPLERHQALKCNIAFQRLTIEIMALVLRDRIDWYVDNVSEL